MYEMCNMDETKLRMVTSEKDLGVITDNELTFIEHTFEGEICKCTCWDVEKNFRAS